MPELTSIDSALDESSGLAWHDDTLWTINDSGGGPYVYAMDLQGRLQRSVQITNADNVDWEALAHDETHLYIGDTGNNLNLRDQLTVYRVAWEDLNGDTAPAQRIDFRYGDHQRGDFLSHNFDAEGLAVRDQELWLFTKNRGDKRSRLYRFPKQPGSYQPMPSQTLPVGALITGADIHPESGELALLGDLALGRANSLELLWLIPTSDTGVDWQQARAFRITQIDQWEAIAWDGPGATLYLSHEKSIGRTAGLAVLPLPE